MRKELVTHLDPKSPVSETFRTLRTNIQFMNSNRRLRSLLVTSTMPGEGKSWVSTNICTSREKSGINRCRYEKRKIVFYIWS